MSILSICVYGLKKTFLWPRGCTYLSHPCDILVSAKMNAWKLLGSVFMLKHFACSSTFDLQSWTWEELVNVSSWFSSWMCFFTLTLSNLPLPLFNLCPVCGVWRVICGLTYARPWALLGPFLLYPCNRLAARCIAGHCIGYTGSSIFLWASGTRPCHLSLVSIPLETKSSWMSPCKWCVLRCDWGRNKGVTLQPSEAMIVSALSTADIKTKPSTGLT